MSPTSEPVDKSPDERSPAQQVIDEFEASTARTTRVLAIVWAAVVVVILVACIVGLS